MFSLSYGILKIAGGFPMNQATLSQPTSLNLEHVEYPASDSFVLTGRARELLQTINEILEMSDGDSADGSFE